MFETITAVIHGQSGVGKSTLADTAPEPRLILDAEGGAKFTPSRKILWDPTMYAPPIYDGTWDTCIVQVRNFDTLRIVYQILESGNHPFRSVILDSLTEIQKRCMDAIVGMAGMDQQDWGTLLRQMESLVRQYRDLTMHPTNPLAAVIYVALSSEKDGKYRAHVQGSLGITLPGYVDVVMYAYTRVGEDGQLVFERLVAPHPNFDAKDRTGRLGTTLGGHVTIKDMMAMVFGRQEPAPVSTPLPPAPSQPIETQPIAQ